MQTQCTHGSVLQSVKKGAFEVKLNRIDGFPHRNCISWQCRKNASKAGTGRRFLIERGFDYAVYAVQLDADSIQHFLLVCTSYGL